MKTWSIPAGRILGVDVRLHLSFLLLVLFISLPTAEKGGAAGLRQSAILVGIILASAFLHEIGHILAAHAAKAPFRATMLLPIGGIQLRDGTEPQRTPSLRNDIWIALAGPTANLIVAILSSAVFLILHPGISLLARPFLAADGDPLKNIIWVNLGLVALNLVPAYPLDGGRVLRAIFAEEMDYRAATRRAVTMGQVFAMFLIFAGIWNSWLMLTGFYLFLSVQIEDRTLIFQSVMESVLLEDVMLTDFSTLSPADTLEDALHKAVHSLQDDFPVIRGNDLVGVVSRQKILRTLRDEGNGYVQSVMTKAFDLAGRKESLAAAFRRLTTKGGTIIPVVDGNHLVGIVTLQNLMHSIGLLAESRKLRRAEE